MKKYAIFIPFMLVISILNAQNVHIPDANFKSYLLANTNINKNGDTAISVREAANFTGSMLLNVKSISSMKGIEAFVNLKNLNCSGNPFTEIDLSKNSALMYFTCVNHRLESLDLSQNPLLTYVSCQTGSLKKLDISANQNLITLVCTNNNLTDLNVSKNAALANLDCRANPKLLQICVKSEAEASANTGFVKDAAQTWIQGCFATGLEENTTSNSLFIYPNPARNQVLVDANAVSCIFYNQMGMVVLRSNSPEIDIQELTTGVYYVHVNYPNRVVKQRLIKE